MKTFEQFLREKIVVEGLDDPISPRNDAPWNEPKWLPSLGLEIDHRVESLNDRMKQSGWNDSDSYQMTVMYWWRKVKTYMVQGLSKDRAKDAAYHDLVKDVLPKLHLGPKPGESPPNDDREAEALVRMGKGQGRRQGGGITASSMRPGLNLNRKLGEPFN